MTNRNYEINTAAYREIRTSSYTPGDHKTPLPYEMTFLTYKKDSFTTYNGSTFYGNMGLGEVFTVPQGAKNNVQIANLLKVNDRLKDSSFNASVFLAEGRDTISLIGNTINRLSQSVIALRHGNIVQSARALGLNLTPKHHRRVSNALASDRARGVLSNTSKSASNAWLELQFGWLPLLSDIHSGAEALANIQFAPKKLTARASNRAGGSPEPTGFKVGKQYVSGHANWDVSTIYQAGIQVAISSEPNNIGRLGLDTPYTALWNVVPWSFLVDYVIPIGDYINAKEAINKLDVLSYMKWEKTIVRMRGNWLPSFGAMTSTPAIYQTVDFRRLILPPNSLKDVPLPSVKTVESIFSTSHILNSIALLRGAFK